METWGTKSMDNRKAFFLTEQEVKFISNHFPDLNLDNKLLRVDNNILLKLNISEQTKFVSDLTDLLISIGLDKDNEPNEIGFQIEHLIDIFNPYRQ